MCAHQYPRYTVDSGTSKVDRSAPADDNPPLFGEPIYIIFDRHPLPSTIIKG